MSQLLCDGAGTPVASVQRPSASEITLLSFNEWLPAEGLVHSTRMFFGAQLSASRWQLCVRARPFAQRHARLSRQPGNIGEFRRHLGASKVPS